MSRRKPVDLPDITEPDVQGPERDILVPVTPIETTEEPAIEVAPQELGYWVAKSRSVKTEHGLLHTGDPVTEADVGGERTLAALIRGGSVIRQ